MNFKRQIISCKKSPQNVVSKPMRHRMIHRENLRINKYLHYIFISKEKENNNTYFNKLVK